MSSCIIIRNKLFEFNTFYYIHFITYTSVLFKYTIKMKNEWEKFEKLSEKLVKIIEAIKVPEFSTKQGYCH